MILFQIFIFGYLFFYVYFLCKQRIYLCPLYHSLIPYDKYENIEQIFLDNGTSLLVFMPLDNNATIFENILFFFNDSAGNCSTHYAMVRLIQKLYPTFTIVQLEYSGFGFSFESKLLLYQIQKSALQAFEFLHEEQNETIKQYICFGHRFGAHVISYIMSQLPSSIPAPTEIIFYNSINRISDIFEHRVPFPFHIFLSPSFAIEKTSDFLKKSKCFLNVKLIETDMIQHSLYFNLENLSNCHVDQLSLKGKEKFSLLYEKNYHQLKKFLQNEAKHFIFYEGHQS